MSQFMDTLLPSQPLSDICLRVYFSDDYSDADFIIINTALCCTIMRDFPKSII